MKTLIMLAGAAMLATTVPAAAKPGEGHGKSNHAAMNHGNVHKASAKSGRGVIVSDRYGRLYALNAHGACPPGLAKKHNGCMPPGQAKKTYNVGQRYNRNFGNTWTYNQIPEHLRNDRFDQNDRYYYNNGYLYQVDPKTMLVQQVISALLR
ncbi:MAG: hypothetical protein ABIO43_09355 [Sphingomicrobium sp.]